MTAPLATLTLGTLGPLGPVHTALALLDSQPGLRQRAAFTTETLCLLPAAAMDFKLLLRVLLWARERVERGAWAVILIMPRDSLEESAYFFELLWDHDAPLVLTEGAAQLDGAITVALDPTSRRRGVLVVIDQHLHSALHVQPAHVPSLELFAPPVDGPVGLLQAGRCHYFRPPRARQPLPQPLFIDHRVALLEASLGDDTDLVEQVLTLDYSGLVVAAQGAGEVPPAWALALEMIAAQIPVVIASRCGADTARSELQRRGLLMAGPLSPRKARVRLWMLLAAGVELGEGVLE